MNDHDQYNKILGESIILQILLNVSFLKPIPFTNFTNKLLRLINSSKYKSTEKPDVICFIFKNEISKNTLNIFLNLKQIIGDIELDISNVLFINYNGEILKNEQKKNIIETSEDAINYTFNNEDLLFFINQDTLQFFFKGEKIAKQLLNKRNGVLFGKELPISEYQQLFDNFNSQKLEKQQGFFYWDNKKEYILIKEPEKHFRKHLANFLKENSFDTVIEEYRVNGTDDSVDIAVITRNFEYYFFEIKWIGKSEKSNYDGNQAIKRVNEGMLQLNEYLKIGKNVKFGLLTVFDARKDKKQLEVWKKIKDTINFKIKKKPYIFPLEAISASKKATKEVLKYKN